MDGKEVNVSIDGDGLERYEGVSAGTIGHFRTEGFMDVGIQALARPVRVLGRAFTVSCQPTDNAPVSAALTRAAPGDILVIDRQGDRRHACWGGILTQAAKLAGLAGVVIDGAATDWREITESGFPVFCTNLSALTTRRLELEGSLGEPIMCGGVCVSTGDVVLGDDDGVVVLPAAEAEAVLTEAERREAREERMLGFLAQGLPLAEARRRALE
jgi:regulator of RNase E activity RraA